jgi:excisionase family DNA binding protein
MEHLMTSEEVAEYLHVDPVTIRRLVAKGELAAYRIGADYRFAPADVETYLQRQRISGGEGANAELADMIALHANLKFPYDKFTEQARGVLNFALHEAQRFHHTYIGTEHLLLGLLDAGENVATQVLRNMGIELSQVRSKVEAIIGRSNRILLGEIALAPRAKKVLALSIDEAQRSGHDYVGPEHLLLALIRMEDGIAAGVLASLGVSLEKARTQTSQVLNAAQTPHPPAPPGAPSPLAEGEQGLPCTLCGARSPSYFRYCFNCGQPLTHEEESSHGGEA